MQNMDFYDGRFNRNHEPVFTPSDPEYFSRMTTHHTKEIEKSKKRASRMLFIIAALCIISFTTGLIIGIKFAGGENRHIIDESTYKAMSQMGNKMSDMIQSANKNTAGKAEAFPPEIWPYVIGLEQSLEENAARKIAKTLSEKGYTVILSKKDSLFKVYIGPFKSENDAKESLKEIIGHSLLPSKAVILSRK